jgi:hypothetical protein
MRAPGADKTLAYENNAISLRYPALLSKAPAIITGDAGLRAGNHQTNRSLIKQYP